MTTYYNLEKTAEVLGVVPGDVNRLREQGKLQGFRDGSNWKFRQSDVEDYLTKSIKEGSGEKKDGPAAPNNDDSFSFYQDEPDYRLGGEDEDSALEDASDVSDVDPSQPGDSGVYVLGDDEEQQGTPAASKIDLAGESGLSLGSAGGLNLGVDSGLSLLDEGGDASRVDLDKGDVVLGGGSASQISFGGESSISLIPEEESFSLADDSAMASASSAQQAEETQVEPATEDEIFQLIGDPTPAPASPASTSGEDFQLAPGADAQQESDSESASQVITLADDNLFLAEDEGGTYGIADEKPATPAAAAPATPAPAAPAADPFATAAADPFATAAADPFATGDSSDSDSGINPFADMADLAGAAPSTPVDPFAQGPVAAPAAEAGPDFTQATPDFSPEAVAEVATAPAANTGGCAWALGRGCQQEAKYSGAEILLFLVPSLIILIPSAIAVYELVRSIWSWGEPYELSGTLVETIGNLVNLINK
ncbi:MAG: helix-turn-helix domain-containing protein [Planctomycetia bacterium]|nr:helix-turn-helix domain-containing protein [Planctomycetia bacterium]